MIAFDRLDLGCWLPLLATHRCGFPGIQLPQYPGRERDVTLMGCPGARSQPSDPSSGQHWKMRTLCVQVFPLVALGIRVRLGTICRWILSRLPSSSLCRGQESDERFARDSSDRYVKCDVERHSRVGANTRRVKEALHELKNHRNGKLHSTTFGIAMLENIARSYHGLVYSSPLAIFYDIRRRTLVLYRRRGSRFGRNTGHSVVCRP